MGLLRSRHVRSVLRCGAAALTLGAAPAAPAAAQSGHPRPNPPDTAALARAGIHVTWPFDRGEELVQPGDEIRVRIRSPKRRVTVSLGRIAVNDGPEPYVVARRRLRRGVFRATVPAGWRRLYALTLHAAGRRYRTILSTAACPKQGTARPVLTLERTQARRGETIPSRLHNTGTACHEYGAGHTWERRRDDGSWERVPDDRVWPAIAYVLYPGGSDWLGLQVWPELEPGRHRVRYGGAPPVEVDVLP